METTAIQNYEEKGAQLLSQARAISITDQATRESAAEFTSTTRRIIKVVEDEFKPDIQKANELHKGLFARMKKLTEPFKRAQAIVDTELKRDYLEQERLRRKEEEEVRAKVREEERLLQEELDAKIEASVDAGDLETAEAFAVQEVEQVPVPIVAPVEKTTRTMAGSTTMKKDIEVVLVDKEKVLIAVLSEELPSSLIIVDMGAVKRYAKSIGATSLPGFKITETAVVSGRRY